MKEKGPPGCLQGPPQEMGGAQREGEQSKLQPKSRVVHFAFQYVLHKLQENKETVSGYVTQQVNQIYDKCGLSYLGLTKASWQRCDSSESVKSLFEIQKTMYDVSGAMQDVANTFKGNPKSYTRPHLGRIQVVMTHDWLPCLQCCHVTIHI